MKIAYLLYAAYLLIAISAQVFQKIGMNRVGPINQNLMSKETIVGIVTTPPVVVGVFLAILGYGLWLIVISNFKMSYIYSLNSVAYILMAIASVVFLKEQITGIQWVAILLIVGGCILLNTKF